jgi:small subunit ribosomal protein S18
MARNSRERKVQSKRKPAEGKGRPRGKAKVCAFCASHAEWIDYKDTASLRRFVNDRGRIKSRGATGTCAQHQRDVAAAVKTARELVLLPYVVRTLVADKGDRRGGMRRGRPNEGAPAAGASDQLADGAAEDVADQLVHDNGADAAEEEVSEPVA